VVRAQQLAAIGVNFLHPRQSGEKHVGHVFALERRDLWIGQLVVY
jgi:hypothetical protein